MDLNVKERALKEVDGQREEIIKFLQDLVRVPSVFVAGDEAGCQDIVVERFKAMGLQIDRWEPEWDDLKKHPAYVPVETWMPEYEGLKNRPVVVGSLKGSGGGRSLLLNGHIDVVTPEPVDKWKHGPFDAEISDGKLFGRGAADMKAGVVAMIMALDCVLRAGVELKGDVIIESVSDEETGGNGTLACLLKGYAADAGIFTEPTELKIDPGHLGGQFFRINVAGRWGHIGLRTAGVNALEKAFLVFKAMRDWEEERCKLGRAHPLYKRYLEDGYPVPSSDAGIIKGGPYGAGPAEECMLEGATHVMPGENVEELREKFRRYIERATSKDPWLAEHKPEIDYVGLSFEGAEIPVDHPIVKTLEASYREALGGPGEISALPCGCDMRLRTNWSNTPSLVFGPGSLMRAHSVDEYVSLEEVINSTKVLALTILSWCGY